MLLRVAVIALLSLSVASAETGGQCNSKDSDCGKGGVFDEAEYNTYKFKHLTNRDDFIYVAELDDIDMTKHVDPMKSKERLLNFLKLHPGSPRALSALARVYRILYNQLSDENKSIGRIEYIKKSVEACKELVKQPPNVVPFDLRMSVTEFGLANCDALKEREWSVDFLKTILEEREDSYDEEDLKYYTESLIEEQFYLGHYDEVKELINKVISEDTNNSTFVHFEFMKILIKRIEDKQIDDLYYREDGDFMLDATPSSEAEIVLLMNYMNTMDPELRLEGKDDIVDIMFELAVDIGIYPSRYQRPTTYVRDLMAKPVWDLEDMGSAKEKLLDLQANWETIKQEALVLLDVLPEENYTRGELNLDRNGKWKQFMFHGFGYPAFPDHVCEKAPVTCEKLRNFPEAVEAPLGTMKLSIIEGGAYIEPHVGGMNGKLRAHLSLVVPKSKNATMTSDSARMIVAKKNKLTWEEGKLFVFDDSFEHEVINETDGTRVVLIVDIKHPELSQKQLDELNKRFNVEDFGNPDGPVMMGQGTRVDS